MSIKYQSTRGGVSGVSFEDIVFSAYAPDGGLFVPETVPIIDLKTLKSFCGLTYDQLVARIASLYVDDSIRPYLNEMCKNAFSHFDSTQKNLNNENTPVPLKKVGSIYILEAFHGPTLAFKDIGLNLLAQMMDHILKQRNEKHGQIEKANVLVETSGDTGPAAVASIILNTKYVNIFAMFPRKQVSPIQARQLTTVKSKYPLNSDNVKVYATDKTSDDQCIVMKQIFSDNNFVKKYNICAMNSINFVRILGQITYYYWAYIQLFGKRMKDDSNNNSNELALMDVVIPSGAFGNTISACFAKCMGLPIRYIVPSTNENDIIYRTLTNGDFSSNVKNYHWTLSPAMDVQVPYNIERFFYLVFNKNTNLVKRIMTQFENIENSKHGIFKYQFDSILQSYFQNYIKFAYKTDDIQISRTIETLFEKYNYLPCPHSSCAIYAAFDFEKKLNEKNETKIPIVCVATAHASKFPEIIEKSMKNISDKTSYQNWFNHPFLPKPNDKEDFTLLPSDNDWEKQWIDILKTDVAKKNQSMYCSANRSKL